MEAGQQMEAEELVDIPEIEKNADPFRHSKIVRIIDGTTFTGYVEDIEVGQISKERLYRIRYNDGDLEHFTADQVQQYLIAESKPEEMPVSKKPAMASEEEHEAVPPSSATLAGKNSEAVASVEEEIEEQAKDVHVFKKPAAAKDHIDEEMGEENEAEAEVVDDNMETSIPVVHKKPAIAQDEPEEEEEEDVEEEDEEEVKTVVSKKPAMKVEPVRKSIAKSPAKPPTKSPAKPPAKSPAKSPAKAKAKALFKKPAAK